MSGGLLRGIGTLASRETWSAAALPAVACVLVGLLLPLVRIPAAFLSAFFGTPALVIVPVAVLGAALGKSLSVADETLGERADWASAGGFAAGALLATLLFGASCGPTVAHFLLAGVGGGLGLAATARSPMPARLALALLTPPASAFALARAPRISLIGRG